MDGVKRPFWSLAVIVLRITVGDLHLLIAIGSWPWTAIKLIGVDLIWVSIFFFLKAHVFVIFTFRFGISCFIHVLNWYDVDLRVKIIHISNHIRVMIICIEITRKCLRWGSFCLHLTGWRRRNVPRPSIWWFLRSTRCIWWSNLLLLRQT